MPVPGYNRQGRGYPDISLAAANYLVMVGGGYGGIAGTSASCPVAAGLMSNINAARMAIGKGSLGWMHPTLYAKAHLFTNDVVTGDNKCPWGKTCCTEGFSAVTGWDPATGFGSVNYGKMQAPFSWHYELWNI
jgi:tripeptidyl-peptidase I